MGKVLPNWRLIDFYGSTFLCFNISIFNSIYNSLFAAAARIISTKCILSNYIKRYFFRLQYVFVQMITFICQMIEFICQNSMDNCQEGEMAVVSSAAENDVVAKNSSCKLSLLTIKTSFKLSQLPLIF